MRTITYEATGSATVQECLACGSSELHPLFDLGRHPLANNLIAEDDVQDEPTYPLGIQFCRHCLLVQLTHIVDPSRIFSSYLYVPSTSTTWLEHCEELAEYVSSQAGLQPRDLVIEIGSNDGTLLRPFQRRGQRVLGIDPATNIAEQANAAGVPTLNRFFGESTATEVLAEHGAAHAILSTNVLAHVPDPVGLLRGVRALLAPDAIYVNESPSLREMVLHSEFDTIYHEHVSYFSLHALNNLFQRAGLSIFEAIPQTLHGGTLRVLALPTARSFSQSDCIEQILEKEREAGVVNAAGLTDFAKRASSVREQLRQLIVNLRFKGERLAAYGATAKGNTLLGYCGLTSADIEYIVDRNPLKQGRFTPGSRIPIVSENRLKSDPPDMLLLLAWNLADEIRRQLSWFQERGGRFLAPVPEPRILG
jgi:hypothetical protein